jgi:hypothetical protein
MNDEETADAQQTEGRIGLAPIRVDGSVKRSFLFPAELLDTFDYYQNYINIFHYLPHIDIDKVINQNEFRLKYETIELGMYRIKIFCRIQAELLQNEFSIRMKSIEPAEKPPDSRGIYSATTSGEFTSVSQFESHQNQTIVHYQLNLRANLPAPYGLALIPEAARNRLSAGITRYRIDEIAAAFIRRSVDGYLRLLTNSQ